MYPYRFIPCSNVTRHKFFRALIILNRKFQLIFRRRLEFWPRYSTRWGKRNTSRDAEIRYQWPGCCILTSPSPFWKVRAGFLGTDQWLLDWLWPSVAPWLYSWLMKENGSGCVNTLHVITKNHNMASSWLPS